MIEMIFILDILFDVQICLLTSQYEKHRSEEDAKLQANPPVDLPADLFYMKQIIHNACGTIALVHSIANNKE